MQVNKLIKNINNSIFKLKLKCYPRECLCSNNLRLYDDKMITYWSKYLKNNNSYCAYNPDGSKKIID